ncbi:MAG: hypothetical protein COB20_13795 [SAR86 cluster bacterium]|uniref:Uncharacterized protein n=1 Tax=SAR86 cluster bacterium TaxID=2030880 RepID=A0A2A4WZ14_9GAMM|nr:MAG: hypothetical protein COB20_13795 [SAR86 cluster bacterium]
MLLLLKQRKTLWVLFLATIALAVGFQLATPLAGGALLDVSTSLAASEDLLQAMSAQQKRAHMWITLLLDVPFPLAYGGLFLGLCLRYGGKFALYLAAPAFLVIPVDLTENAVQFIALLGNETLLPAKTYLTPAKFLLFYSAAIVALGSLSLSLVLSVLRKSN